MKVGYARVSTTEQCLDQQVGVLRASGCVHIYAETMSGAAAHRPQWEAAMDAMQPGDELVVTRLDRAGRSLRHLLEVLEVLQGRGCALEALEQGLNTGTSTGRLMFGLLSVVAEFERALIAERTKDALAARGPGQRGGRPPALDARSLARAQTLYDNGAMTVGEVAAAVGVSSSTLYRRLELRRRHSTGG